MRLSANSATQLPQRALHAILFLILCDGKGNPLCIKCRTLRGFDIVLLMAARLHTNCILFGCRDATVTDPFSLICLLGGHPLLVLYHSDECSRVLPAVTTRGEGPGWNLSCRRTRDIEEIS
jgi:hypothetical protein